MTDTPARDPAVPLDLWAADKAWDDAACDTSWHDMARRAVQLALAVRDSEHAAQDAKVAGLVEAFACQLSLVERFCDAVDRAAEDIGGEQAIPVVRWLGERIAAVDALTERTPR